MSQDGDYSVANAAGATVRGEVNDIFGDIKSMNSGTSAPSSPIEGMLWYDTTNDLIKIYQAGAWRTLAVDPMISNTLNDGTIVNGALIIVDDLVVDSVAMINDSITVETIDARQQNTAGVVAFLLADTGVSYGGGVLYLAADAVGTTGYKFIQALSDFDGSSTLEYQLFGDGSVLAKSFTQDGLDYAELFEWLDGNPNNEDRVGLSVFLDGDKIREAKDGEEPDGVISANPGVIGNAAGLHWHGKFLRDEFGRIKGGKRALNPEYKQPESDIPQMITEPGKRDKKTGKKEPDKQIRNPQWHPDVGYKPRTERQEWGTVGLLGQLAIRVGQVKGSRWKKLKDLSESVELWLVK